MKPVLPLVLACALGCAAPAAADFELSLYTGWQTSPHSRISGTYPNVGGTYDALIGWEGRSFEMPPYYGVRGMWWRGTSLGFGVEFTHAKVYAPDSELPGGFTNVEMTDGLNIVTVNVVNRWPDRWGGVTPYLGGGLGVAVPHVDVDHNSGASTYEFQLTGPAARLTAGVSYPVSERVSVFGEYQFTMSSNDMELDGGGTMATDVVTNALNVGLSLNF